MGYPKSGSHFLLQILSQLGYKRMYDQGSGDGKITTLPTEYQTKAALETMEKLIKENKNTRYVLNHSHVYPFHLPATKGMFHMEFRHKE